MILDKIYVVLIYSIFIVCHHPPISAFYLESDKDGVSLNGHCKLFLSDIVLILVNI
jgi:hypothetical protein